MGIWSNDLLRIAQIKTLLKQQINRLIPGSIDNNTPFREYPDTLESLEIPKAPKETINDIITFEEMAPIQELRIVKEDGILNLGEKVCTPAVTHEVLVCSDKYTSVSNNSNNWGYDNDKGFYNNAIGDSQNTKMVIKVDDYRNICYPDAANLMPVTIYQSSEHYYDYGQLYGSSDGSTLDTLLVDAYGLSGTRLTDVTISTFYPYLILYYRKDGGGTNGEDRCYFKFDRINFTKTTVIDVPEEDYFVS